MGEGVCLFIGRSKSLSAILCEQNTIVRPKSYEDVGSFRSPRYVSSRHSPVPGRAYSSPQALEEIYAEGLGGN